MEIYGIEAPIIGEGYELQFDFDRYDYELDLSDREAVTTTVTALDGTRHTTVKGEYINPKITLHYPDDITRIQNHFNAMRNRVFPFRPYADNRDYEFAVRIINAYPENDGGAELQKFIIEMESVGYVTTVGLN